MTERRSKAAAHKYDLDSHFRFGRNWRDYAAKVGDAQIKAAEQALHELLPAAELKGKSFLDLGCGSGLHTLAALRSGVAHAHAIDFDPVSVATAKRLIGAHWSGNNASFAVLNILDPDPEFGNGRYDLVYSWGVLHHTGAMWEAIERAAHLVAPRGKLVIALYKKTPLCRFWRWEKRLYKAGPRGLAEIATYLCAGLFVIGLAARGTNPTRYIRGYKNRRGMSWMTDLRDWLGGYPYESASPDDVVAFVGTLGFDLARKRFTDPPPIFGLFGSGCAEWVFRRT